MAKNPTLVLASRNPGKIREFQTLLGPLGIGLEAFTGPPALEDGETFAENAIRKARGAALHSSRPALADDSGLEVEALGGQPGVHSHRFAGEGADDQANNQELLRRLAGIEGEKRSARFVAVLALATPDGQIWTWRGETAGRILTQPQGEMGFGYDPLFLSEDLGVSFAQADAVAKNRVSHRGRACQAFLADLPGILADLFA